MLPGNCRALGWGDARVGLAGHSAGTVRGEIHDSSCISEGPADPCGIPTRWTPKDVKRRIRRLTADHRDERAALVGIVAPFDNPVIFVEHLKIDFFVDGEIYLFVIFIEV